jgi:hypothetical protein
MPITKEQARVELAKRELARRQQNQQPNQQPNRQPEQQGLAQKIGGLPVDILRGLIQPALQVGSWGGQAIDQMVTGKQPTDINLPIPQALGGPMQLSGSPKSFGEGAGATLKTLAMGSPNIVLGGAGFSAGQTTEEGGTPEQVASSALMGGMAGKTLEQLPNLISSGKSTLKKILKYDNSLKQAEKAKVALDKVRTTIGKAKELALQDVKDTPVDFDWGKMPKLAQEKIKNPDYGIEFTKEGGPINTIGNLDKIKTALQDIPTTKDYVEAGNMSKRKVLQFAGEVRDAMVKAANDAGRPELGKALKDYHNFMENYNLANDHLVDKYGNAMANKLRSTFRLFSEPSVKEAWKEIGKSSPEIKGIIKSRTNRELLKALLITAPTIESGKRIITGRW